MRACLVGGHVMRLQSPFVRPSIRLFTASNQACALRCSPLPVQQVGNQRSSCFQDASHDTEKLWTPVAGAVLLSEVCLQQHARQRPPSGAGGPAIGRTGTEPKLQLGWHRAVCPDPVGAALLASRVLSNLLDHAAQGSVGTPVSRHTYLTRSLTSAAPQLRPGPVKLQVRTHKVLQTSRTAAQGDAPLALPHLAVPSIDSLDWGALARAGFRGCVFDKDNTLTAPYAAAVAPALRPALERCRAAFDGRLVLFSNSAGLAQYDPEGAPRLWTTTSPAPDVLMKLALTAAAAPGNAVPHGICQARHGATPAGTLFLIGGSASCCIQDCVCAKPALSRVLSGEQVGRPRRWRRR